MNAAARIIHQTNFFSGQLVDIRLSKHFYYQITLLLAVLISALAVVYTTNMYRLTLSQLQVATQQTHQLQLQRGQLLLEQASLSTPSRVQEMAFEKLRMILPVEKQTYILRIK